MRIPEITHLQFSVLATLMGGEQSGQSVRDELRRLGVKKSGPSFYQLMARLEDASFVVGRYASREIEGQLVKERRYKLTGKGTKALECTRDFYLRQSPAMFGGLASA